MHDTDMTNLISRSLLLLTVLFIFSSCETLEIPKSTTGKTKKSSSLSLASRGLHRTGKTHKGKASWYSVSTNGGTTTASGERLRNDGMTAARKMGWVGRGVIPVKMEVLGRKKSAGNSHRKLD